VDELIKRLDEIEARCKAATEGPWTDGGLRLIKTGRGVVAQCPRPQDGGVFDVQDNFKFLLHARDDIPWLLEQLRARAHRTPGAAERGEGKYGG
jgi:hypothetical protein